MRWIVGGFCGAAGPWALPAGRPTGRCGRSDADGCHPTPKPPLAAGLSLSPARMGCGASVQQPTGGDAGGDALRRVQQRRGIEGRDVRLPPPSDAVEAPLPSSHPAHASSDPTVTRLRHELELKLATLTYLKVSTHLSTHEEEGLHLQQIGQLRAEAAGLKDQLWKLCRREAGESLPWHTERDARDSVRGAPADTNFGTGLTAAAAAAARGSPPITPLEEGEARRDGDEHERRPMEWGSGVQLAATKIDAAQRRAEANLQRRAAEAEQRALEQREDGVRCVRTCCFACRAERQGWLRCPASLSGPTARLRWPCAPYGRH
jgi:hypothetical protein